MFAEPDVEREDRPDGSVVFRSRAPLGPYPRSVAAMLRDWAEADPAHPLVAERAGDGWATLTYGEVRDRADALGQALLDRGLGPHRPLMILSGNSVAHFVLTLGALTAGVPVAPISVAYSLLSTDHARIRDIASLLRPGLVFAEAGGPFAAALAAVEGPGVVLAYDVDAVPGAESLDDLLATAPGPELAAAYAATGPGTLAKVLFTSGSTGSPKGVLNTHRMLCSNQQAIRQAWPFLAGERPVLVDWLPWSHTFGGNHNVDLVLRNGGTLYLDDGKPAPQLFGRSLENLRSVPPTLYFNVPAGYAQLVPVLERDPEFARVFFSRLRLLFNAAAALPAALRSRLEAAAAAAGADVPLTGSWGATETAPAVTSAHFPFTDARCIGVPLPGLAVKLAPVGEAHEIRVRGDAVTPGYLHRPDLTEAAFDDEGFYRTGDAAVPASGDPNTGLLFGGRIAEDFKLDTGTFVRVGALRTALLSAVPLLSDVVLAGENRQYIGALAWLNQAEARLAGPLDEADGCLVHAELAGQVAKLLAAMNSVAGSAGRVERLVVLAEPPDLDAGEITDKGYLNQRRVLARRAALVERLYADEPDVAVIVAG
ncbi:feruloyl-CoA synthase [Amycolatopsis sp. FDAARGOS 1241]|uniref:feruloyl-CoA synthase n=1 Tax=Amycolatopsis sp. FDAARGOS 1241 TaxID=2778070 RepID=UPI00195055CA|nr:feruloyl-CoA synthase [Amycolatopsis sp. FDAARGOS 1241]QRP47636.1 feruloyl-CoA synthase [Amycolatopsis sp. FDAARGOS 1241]